MFLRAFTETQVFKKVNACHYTHDFIKISNLYTVHDITQICSKSLLL